MNIVAIDPSTTCTGICINGNRMVAVAQESLVCSKKGDFVKWFDLASNICEIKTYENYKEKETFTGVEVEKLRYYQTIANIVIKTVEEKYKPHDTKICIEGFSYNSKAGNLIDLVTFSTLIRSRFLNNGYGLIVVPPMSLKQGAAKLVYPRVDIKNKDRDPKLTPLKPKFMYLNPEGVPGGKFKKHEMLRAIVDSHFKDDWKKFIDANYSDISSMKSIPAPIADLNDAYLLYHYIKDDK